MLEGSSIVGEQVNEVYRKMIRIRGSMQQIKDVFDKLESGLMGQLRDLSKNTEVKFKAPSEAVKGVSEAVQAQSESVKHE